MMEKKEKLEQRHLPESGELAVVCPRCGELLLPADLESYFKCPFCNYAFARTGELEDFLAAPAISQWLHSQRPSTPSGF